MGAFSGKGTLAEGESRHRRQRPSAGGCPPRPLKAWAPQQAPRALVQVWHLWFGFVFYLAFLWVWAGELVCCQLLFFFKTDFLEQGK